MHTIAVSVTKERESCWTPRKSWLIHLVPTAFYTHDK
jgi:hypothetical protein